MTDDDDARAVLGAVLARAGQEGFSPALLTSVQGDAVFPAGIAAVVAFWASEIDAALEQQLVAMELAALPVRARIRVGVLSRLALLKPHKDAARKAALLPQALGDSATSLWHTADIIWRAAGDRSTDFNFYSKRAILAAVLSSTMVAWFGDDSDDERHTAAFLDARIDNVLAYEKLKARFKQACANSTAPQSGNAS
ncbi:MAG: COQ9 family protein [Rhizomicrobium sp.]|nr:COQ9 family protein [Rhizomicrobium sp.]